MKINDTAIEALVHNPGVRRHVEQQAQLIVDDARERAKIIMHRKPDVVSAINYRIDEDGRAVIGISDEGSISRYLAKKEGHELVWLVPAMAQVFTH